MSPQTADGGIRSAPIHRPRRIAFSLRSRRPLLALAVVIAVLRPYMFSIASSGSTFTLSNQTHHYLHVTVNNVAYTYLAPARSIEVKVDAPSTVTADVRYSPGQGIKGAAQRSFPITKTVTSTDAGSSTCWNNNDDDASTCESTGPSTTTTVTSAHWDVAAADLSAN